ncbi:hypothetical protein BELL_1366g00010 [Botrytis elliptica]|uniref:Uncharacterized protein n=1 Tax=Botrytis elliptica TaxID=278938 RepID=A0A4Z1I631_9HELO|nr:hypothetical protein BELL_1366g00010 [Botrytis elliptica]
MLESEYITLNIWQESLDRLELQEELEEQKEFNGACLKLSMKGTTEILPSSIPTGIGEPLTGQPTSKKPLPRPLALVTNQSSARHQRRNGRPSTTNTNTKVSKISSAEFPSYMSSTESSSRKQTLLVPGSESKPTKTSRSTSIAGKASSPTATASFTPGPPPESNSKTPHFNRNPIPNKFHVYADYMTGVSLSSSSPLGTLRGEIIDDLGPYKTTFLNNTSVLTKEEPRLFTRINHKVLLSINNE